MINVILASAALAGSALSGAAPTATPEAVAAPAIVAVSAAAEAGQPLPDLSRACVQAFSKNICQSEFHSSAPQFGTCPHTLCRTLYVPQAEWRIPLESNRQNCYACADQDANIVGNCDETPGLNGTIAVSGQYTLRFHGPCAYRGCFEGRWELHTQDGRVYKGRVTGTLGAGSHRFNGHCCNTSADRTCERCLDVEYVPYGHADGGNWRIGVEATFEGVEVTSGTLPADKIHFSLSGDLLAPGDANAPFIGHTFVWMFNGTGDGVHIDYCN
jgi:hypothetical protein